MTSNPSQIGHPPGLWYRPQRGGLAESLAAAYPVPRFIDLVNGLANGIEGLRDGVVSVHPYHHEDDINTWLVSVGRDAVGFVSSVGTREEFSYDPWKADRK